MRGAIFALAIVSLSSISHAIAEEEVQFEIPGGKIDVILASKPGEPLRGLLFDWIRSSANAVTVYYGRFPVSHLQLRIQFFEGRGVRGGRTTGWDGPVISIRVGQQSNATDFSKDWVLTHEMVHLAFPSVPEKHHWIEEGSATYIEPIARARAGALSAGKVWGDLIDGLPNGLPKSGDRGLDFTPTWGRTYWGGALFCLLADIEIRKRTKNQKGLEDALRAILAAGGTIESDWPLDRAFDIGDRATGVPVLHELYGKMKAEPVAVDLDALWRELGVRRQNDKTTFDDNAPMASIRKAITPSRGR